MTFANSLRVLFARLLIAVIHYPWRISAVLLRRQFPVKEHYIIMKVFRALTRRYPVTIQYLNPIGGDQRAITLHLDLCENNQQWYFRLKDRYDREWTRTINLAMDEASSFIDVGSNIGVFALTVAQAHPDKRVIAIEPLLSNYTKLEENIRANGLSNIEPLGAVVAERNDPIHFYVNPIHDGGGSIIEPEEYMTGDVRINAADYQTRHLKWTPSSGQR